MFHFTKCNPLCLSILLWLKNSSGYLWYCTASSFFRWLNCAKLNDLEVLHVTHSWKTQFCGYVFVIFLVMFLMAGSFQGVALPVKLSHIGICFESCPRFIDLPFPTWYNSYFHVWYQGSIKRKKQNKVNIKSLLKIHAV